ncbi:acyltransferase [Acidocella aquatica]|uniref:Acyltransferase n=1 Tax=Acidocella aquatica TaxID=1922313 RepID=A0ABQ5ZZC8_9PROT|nr:acyltransferase [Acidocella aquatica]GLR65575.1 acyltransferase [Acidocella aquatica]
MNDPAAKRPDKLVSLEVARFAAALCVGTDHIVSFTASLSPNPVLGGFDLPPITSVLFFFVLSGFVIYTAHRQDFGQLNRLPRFAWRRFWRIYPVYWLSLAIPLFFLWPTCTPGYLAQIFTLAPFTRNNSFRELIPPAWSLRFEIAFYLMFALALLPRVGRYILGAWIFLAAWHVYQPMKPMGFILRLPHAVAWHFFGVHEIMFFAGLGAGATFFRLRLHHRWLWLLLGGASAALMLLTQMDAWGFAYPSLERTPLVAASFAAIIVSLAALERGGHLRLNQRLTRLGAMSYPFYIIHPSVLFLGSAFIYEHPGDKHMFSPLTVFVAFMAASLIASALVTFLYDRPLQRLARRISP